ncbi:unnamed protein product [Thelazia callipaeda]|uniref:Uncharacterized protein n=1 Tax=Thelazia callipaeda TaxID=103827 RepID=A0A0N5CMP9_THECL|nr:unnamed protein product [Thelazia callipaeda]
MVRKHANRRIHTHAHAHTDTDKDTEVRGEEEIYFFYERCVLSRGKCCGSDVEKAVEFEMPPVTLFAAHIITSCFYVM